MPSPVTSDLHIDALLTEISLAYMNEDGDYIADRAFPAVYVDKQSDKLLEFDDGFFQADEGDSLRRAPGGLPHEVDYKVTTSASYYADAYAAAHGIPDEDRGNADAVFNLDEEAVRLVTEVLRIKREKDFATDFLTTGIWHASGDKAGSTDFTKWNDASSDPFTDIEDGKRTIKGSISRWPNKLVMGDIVWYRLRHHPDILDRIKYGATPQNPANVSRQLVAALLELDEVLVGSAVRRSSNEGASTLTKARIVDDDALLMFTPSSPSRMTPAAGYTFFWAAAFGGQRVPQIIERYRDIPGRHRDVVAAHSWFDQKKTVKNAGYFFSDCVD